VAVAAVEFDPYSYELDEDPYPVYRWLRDRAPVYHNERLDFWALSRFDDVLEASLDWRTYSSARGTVLELMSAEMPVGPMIIFMDPPRQTRLRNLVSKVFTPRRIAALEPEVRSIAVGHLERLAEAGGGDAVQEFTAKLPMDVISALLGIPPADRDWVRERSNAILHREPGNPLPTPDGIGKMGELMGYWSDALRERRQRPRDDIMTRVIDAEYVEETGQRTRLSDPEIQAFFGLIATAGNETVTKLLATALYWLWRLPDQRRILVESPAAIPNAVEETLRFDPPSQYQGRTLTRDVTLHGVSVPKGAKVALLTGSTGRDERRFPDPDRFDVRREIERHLGFGYGQHVCLGKSLARLESRVALEEWLRRFPDYEVDEAGMERMHSSNVRGLARLPFRAH
jgi:cytochrome P450